MISVFQRQKEEAASRGNGRAQLVYSEAPFLVYWELTRACDLACRHCRAEAISQRGADELTLEEIQGILKGIKGFGRRLPHLVLTGGDPLKRPDFYDILDYADRLELRLSVAPSGTPLLTREVFQIFRATGVESISLSLDGPNREKHDGFRGVPGCFERTIEAAREAREEGLGLQVNTLVTAETEQDLPAIYRLVGSLDPMRWSLFFLIPVGRGHGIRPVSPERGEAIYHWLFELSRQAPFAVATTEAPHFRRVALTRMKEQGLSWARIRETPVGRGFGIRDGNGIMFISHTGDVYPSGFLPITAGNVRATPIAEIYRESEVFKRIRQTGNFKGRCGRCEFKEICGGSRARAFAASGDYLDEDPACSYQPGEAAADIQENQLFQ